MPNLLRHLMQQNGYMSPEGDDGGSNGGGGGNSSGGNAGGNSNSPGKETFSREYVQELRQENASYRTRANDAEKKAQEAEAAAKKAKEEADAAIAKAQTDADEKVKQKHTESEQRIIRAELKAEAIKAGMVDLDGLKLADLSAVKIDEQGNVVGAEELLKSLKESKPYLFKEVSSTSHAGDPPPKKDPTPFDARKATPEEVAAKAREMGLKIKTT